MSNIMTTNPAGKLTVKLCDPLDLKPAPWNPNKATPEDQNKLDASISRFGMFKPVICRELEDGSLQILGGHWRVNSAIRLGLKEIPVVNLGDVDDARAKEILLVDNGRYGHDDAGLLADLLRDMGDIEELVSFMPYDPIDLEAITASSKIDLDTLGLDDEDAQPVEKPIKMTKTHQMMRMKVPVEDADRIESLFKAIMQSQDFTDSDQLTNAGDALVWLVNKYLELNAE